MKQLLNKTPPDGDVSGYLAVPNRREYDRNIDLSADETPSVTLTWGAQTSDCSESDRQAADSHPDTQSAEGLQGFLPAGRRPRARYKVFFVSGILRNGEEVDDTIWKVSEHMEQKKCKVKSIRRVKYNHRTLSVKIVVLEESANDVGADSFWPEGIQCRPWVD